MLDYAVATMYNMTNLHQQFICESDTNKHISISKNKFINVF
jgi:hypothetical protein